MPKQPPLRLYCSIESAVLEETTVQQLVITSHQGTINKFLHQNYRGTRVARLALGGGVKRGEHALALADWLDKHWGILTVGNRPLYLSSQAHALDAGLVNIVPEGHHLAIAVVALTSEQLELASARLRELA